MSGLLSRFSIRARLLAAFAVIVAGTIGLGLFAVQRLDGVNGAAAETRDHWLPATRALGEMARTSERIRINQAQMLSDDAKQSLIRPKMMQDQIDVFETARARYASLAGPGEEQRLSDAMMAAWTAYQAVSRAFHDLVSSGKHEQAERFANEQMRDGMLAFRAAIDANLDFQVKEGGAAINRGAALGQAAHTWIILVVAALVVLCVGAGWSLIRGISAPIGRMTVVMRRLAHGELTCEIPEIGRGDEIGGMADAVLVFKENMLRAERLAGEQDSLKASAAEAQRTAMHSTADAFETKVGGLVTLLSAGASALEATARSMSETASRATDQAATVAAAAGDASSGLSTVAASAEELTASIGEIGRQVSKSSEITRHAVADAQRTDAIMRELADGAEKIGHVIQLITNIASQTNLLALNATIEAARAGDAGKGFAVVASEVKNLANQTTNATGEIGAQITQVQSATKKAVDAIRSITETIEAVSAISANIAAAVEQQNAATAEIARNVQQTSQSAMEVTVNIGGVSQAATGTGATAAQVLTAAGALSRQTSQLTNDVNSFVAEVRAA